MNLLAKLINKIENIEIKNIWIKSVLFGSSYGVIIKIEGYTMKYNIGKANINTIIN